MDGPRRRRSASTATARSSSRAARRPTTAAPPPPGVVFRTLDAPGEHPFRFAAPDREHPVRRNGADRLAVLEVVAEAGAAGSSFPPRASRENTVPRARVRFRMRRRSGASSATRSARMSRAPCERRLHVRDLALLPLGGDIRRRLPAHPASSASPATMSSASGSSPRSAAMVARVRASGAREVEVLQLLLRPRGEEAVRWSRVSAPCSRTESTIAARRSSSSSRYAARSRTSRSWTSSSPPVASFR
jgi:hypothetical protein